MKIGVDVRCLAGSSRLTGICQYTRHLLTAMMYRGRQSYRLYPGYRRPNNMNILSIFPDLPANSSWAWSPIPGRFLDLSWRLGWPPVEWVTGPLDIFFEPNFFPPPVKSAAVVTTIPDLSFLRHPEWFPVGVAQTRIRLLEAALKQSRGIIAISRFTADEISECYPQHARKISVVHLAPGPEFSVPTMEQIRNLRQDLQLDGPYFLSVGTLEYRKNIRQLVQAFMTLRQSGQTDACLVLVGGQGFGHDQIIQEARLGIEHGWIRILGYAKQEQLPALYGGAQAVCYLSGYEGFGLPPLEAMACGAPVLASRISVLQEILGPHAIYVDPHDPEEIVSGLSKTEVEKTGDYSERVAWSKQYSWERAADETTQVFAKAV